MQKKSQDMPGPNKDPSLNKNGGFFCLSQILALIKHSTQRSHNSRDDFFFKSTACFKFKEFIENSIFA